MGIGVKILWVRGRYTMDREFDIARIGGQTTMDGVYTTPWIGGSICHGKRVKIPWVGVPTNGISILLTMVY
jgi:beta-glucanase (GH16 family)